MDGKKKYIKRVDPILINGMEPFTQALFIQHLVNSDEKFNSTGPGIRAGIRVEDAFSANTSVIELDENSWQLLKNSADSPSGGYPAIYVTGSDGSVEKLYFGRKLLPFIDAILEASDEKPAEPTDGG